MNGGAGAPRQRDATREGGGRPTRDVDHEVLPQGGSRMSGGAGGLRGSALTLPSPLRALLRAVLLALFAFAIFGPLLNLFLWAFAERWFRDGADAASPARPGAAW